MGTEIRHPKTEDIEALCVLVDACFPPEEVASHESVKNRVSAYPECYWVLTLDGEIAGHVNGPRTTERDLLDPMYPATSCHRRDGPWQMIFSVATLPKFQGRGLASMLLRRVISDCRERGVKGIVLTCHERLLPFYARFGFKDEGMSTSEHGGSSWHQMRLLF